MFIFRNYSKSFNTILQKITLIILILFSLVIKSCVTKEKLRENGIIVNVKIVELIPSGKAGVSCSYRCQFIHKGNIMNLISSSSICNRKKSFVGRYFPALYLEGTDAIRILMKPEDFEDFGIAFPDSLINRVIDIAE